MICSCSTVSVLNSISPLTYFGSLRSSLKCSTNCSTDGKFYYVNSFSER